MICKMHVPWFGDLPFYTDTFLKCCGLSEKIVWIVHSDQQPPALPKNVLWFVCDDVSKKIETVFDAAVIPDRKWRHKLCDLKPFWHIVFNEPDIPVTEYRGWCDWDVVHNLSHLLFNFESAKFTKGSMCSPLYIQVNRNIVDIRPANPKAFLAGRESFAWDELIYLKQIHSSIVQTGLTPEVDLVSAAPYAIHMYRAKHSPTLYDEWIKKYCGFSLAA